MDIHAALNVKICTKFLSNHFFGSPAGLQCKKKSTHQFIGTLQDHAAAGLSAGVVAVLCMHPLDLLKVKLQVATEKPEGGVGKQIYHSLKNIKDSQGWRGLYRGVGPNIAGNASSWGLYFLL